MQREMQNGEATLRRLRTRLARASASPLRQREPRRPIAIPDSQFQTGEQGATKEVPESRAMQRSFDPFGFRFPACPASGARTDTERKTERTSRSCIAR